MAETQSVILEIRAGTGGDEAALFVGDLFDMYSSYAKDKGWKIKTKDVTKTSLGGIKNIAFQIKGKDAYALLHNEGGVHRVQRVPATEKGGRIHTSTVTVAVMEKQEEKAITIRPQDLKVEFSKSSGPGGQNVNKRETAVRITHLPTGTVVESQSGRSQQENREYAMNILKSKIHDHLAAQQKKKRQKKRKKQIGTGERAEKIRTYNFPQNRLTDHRINKSWHNLDHVVEGNLDKVLKTVSKKLGS